jgi:hypothetical protein
MQEREIGEQKWVDVALGCSRNIEAKLLNNLIGSLPLQNWSRQLFAK